MRVRGAFKKGPAEAENGGASFEEFIILTDFRVAKAVRLGECRAARIAVAIAMRLSR
jgi:hypothetical protein